jgi:hypothetical protein
MAAQKCPMCGVRMQEDSTSPCTCVLTAVEEVDAIFEAARPRQETASSRRMRNRAPGRVPERALAGRTDAAPGGAAQAADAAEGRERGRVRLGGRRGKVVVGLVAAAALGAGALTVATMGSGPETDDNGRWGHARAEHRPAGADEGFRHVLGGRRVVRRVPKALGQRHVTPGRGRGPGRRQG